MSRKLFPAAVRDSIVTCGIGAQTAIEGLLSSYEKIREQVALIEHQLEDQIKSDPVIALLESIPGVGGITAMTFKAVIDDPFRFKNPRDLGAYLGITPVQYSSGESIKQGRISKCGCTELRTLLVECGMVILTRTTGWTKLKAWGMKIMKRSGIKKASTAVGRKLAIIMLLMWQRGEPFIWGEKKEALNKKIKTA